MVLAITAVLLPTFLMILTKLVLGITRLTALGVGISVAFLIVIFWVRKWIKQVGTTELPTQAVITRFAEPIDAVGLGLVSIISPFESLKEFPTRQYMMNYCITEGLYSKADEEKGFRSLVMIVDLSVYFRFARVDRMYSFPMPIEDVKKILGKDERLSLKGLSEGLAWGRVSGKELLIKAYYRLPIKNPKEAKLEEFGKFFEGAVEGGLRHVMGVKNHKECKEEKPIIEEEIKNYLLSGEGNPFFECGIPKECLDIELKGVKFSEGVEQSWQAPEIAMKRAMAAKSERKRIKEITKGYIGVGVSPNVAGLLTGGVVEGKGMSFEQLRDLAIFQGIGGLK